MKNDFNQIDVGYSIMLYSFSSCGMMIVNKLAIHNFHLPITLTILQFIFAVIVVIIPLFLKKEKILLFKDTLRWCFVSFLFAMMLSSSMYSFQYVSLGTILMFNNTRTIFSLILEKFINRIDFNYSIMLSLIGIFFGIVIYASHDITFSLIGYFFCFINMISSILERVSQKHLISIYQIPLSNVGMVFYNNLFGIFWLFPFIFIMKENVKYVQEFDQLSLKGLFFVIGSMICGLLISYAGFRLQRRVSATTLLVINNANKIGVLLFSFFIIHEKYTMGMKIGLLISFLFCILYGYLRNKFNEQNNNNNKYDVLNKIILNQK